MPVRKPLRTEFFRVHPDPAFSLDWAVLERNEEQDREIFWVTEKFRGELVDELKPHRLFVCINKRGVVFIWPAKLPSADNTGGRRWHESGLKIAEYAKTRWVKMAGKRDLGAYEMFEARGDLGDPVWPEKSLAELLRLGFEGKVIDSLDHPVLRELAGEM